MTTTVRILSRYLSSLCKGRADGGFLRSVGGWPLCQPILFSPFRFISAFSWPSKRNRSSDLAVLKPSRHKIVTCPLLGLLARPCAHAPGGHLVQMEAVWAAVIYNVALSLLFPATILKCR